MSQEEKQHEVRKRNMQIPGFAKEPLIRREIRHRDHGTGCQQQSAALARRHNPEPDECRPLDDCAADPRGPRGVSRQPRQRCESPEHQRARMVPAGPTVETGQRSIRREHVTHTKVDDRVVVRRPPMTPRQTEHRRNRGSDHQNRDNDTQRNRRTISSASSMRRPRARSRSQAA